MSNRARIRELLSKTTDHDGRLSAMPLRIGDSSPGDATIADMMYGTVGSYDATNDVITTTGTPTPLPTGTPTIAAGVKVYDREGAGFTASDTFYAIKSEAVHTDGTHGQVDWVVIPTAAGSNKMFLVTVDENSASQADGAWATPESGRYFSGSLGLTPDVGDIWILANDHHDDMVDTTPDPDEDYPWLPVHGEFTAFYTGETWDPDPEGTSDERPVYRVEPLPPGLIPGYTASAFSAASNQTTASPTMQTGSFQTYIKDSGGSWVEGPLLTGVLWNQERSVATDTPGFIKRGVDGFWLVHTPEGGGGVKLGIVTESGGIPAAYYDTDHIEYGSGEVTTYDLAGESLTTETWYNFMWGLVDENKPVIGGDYSGSTFIISEGCAEVDLS